MFKLLGTRGTGKTYELCKEASKDKNSVIICSNPLAMKEKIKSYGFPEIECMSYNEIKKIPKKNNIYIDEIDALLLEVYPKIIGYTGSLE